VQHPRSSRSQLLESETQVSWCCGAAPCNSINWCWLWLLVTTSADQVQQSVLFVLQTQAMIPTSVTGHCTSNSSPNQNKSQHESTLSHVNSESSKYCLLYSTVTCCLIPSLIAWHYQFLTLPLANIPLTVWADIATYCLALSLTNSKLLPDTVISWIPITARHCHCLTYCLAPSFPDFQLLPDSVSAWLCHLLPDTVISRLPATTRHCFCMTLSLTA